MQTNQLKPSVERVRYAIVEEENRLSSLLYHLSVGHLGEVSRRIACGVSDHGEMLANTADVDNQRLAVNLSLGDGRGFAAFQQITGSAFRCLITKAFPSGICSS